MVSLQQKLMKYWNKHKTIREKHWTRVKIKPVLGSPIHNIPTAKHFFHNWKDGTGKFYVEYGSFGSDPEFFGCIWVWFERSEDAMWWGLKNG